MISEYYASFSDELQSKMKRLDVLVGRDHWLSVGNYKESLLRGLLSNLLPKKFEVSTGFIMSTDRDGRIIKSKQQDIIIWNSNDYAAIFRDDEFVIVPPEACRAVVEVKSTIDTSTLLKALGSSDGLYEFTRTEASSNFDIKKYIFAFDGNIQFPNKYFDTVARFYTESQFPIDERLSAIRSHWCKTKADSLFSIDGVFVLGQGAILRKLRAYGDDSVRMIFNAFESGDKNSATLYKFFEFEINSVINSDSTPGLFYAKQPGLYSMSLHLGVKECSGKPIMVYPPLDEQHLYGDMMFDKIYVPKC